MIETFLELLLQLFVEVALQLAFEFAAAIGWRAVERTISGDSQTLIDPLRHFLVGIVAGAISLLVYSHRLTPFRFVPGASLLLAPLGTGIIMEALGRLGATRGRLRMALFTFKGGFLFALGMALLRFAYLEIG
jgi:hypothetical protein